MFKYSNWSFCTKIFSNVKIDHFVLCKCSHQRGSHCLEIRRDNGDYENGNDDRDDIYNGGNDDKGNNCSDDNKDVELFNFHEIQRLLVGFDFYAHTSYEVQTDKWTRQFEKIWEKEFPQILVENHHDHHCEHNACIYCIINKFYGLAEMILQCRKIQNSSSSFSLSMSSSPSPTIFILLSPTIASPQSSVHHVKISQGSVKQNICEKKTSNSDVNVSVGSQITDEMGTFYDMAEQKSKWMKAKVSVVKKNMNSQNWPTLDI